MTVTIPTELPNVIKHGVALSFSWYDYILFCVMLTMSALIGIYFGCFGSKQSSTDEYLLGSKKMKVIPIAISLVASHISGITLLAVPADVYRYGATYWLLAPSFGIVAVAAIYIYFPVFYKLQITSTYEYLEQRFNKTNRLLASFLFALGLFSFLPIVIYIPALAFSAATGINVHYITPLVCGICIFYTSLGGLKAVVWTDTLQFTITVGAVVTVVVIGVKSAGGLGSIWATAAEGHRLNFEFNLDLTNRDSFWVVLIGMSVGWIANTAVHQSCVQKILSVPTLRDANLSLVYFFFGMAFVVTFSSFTGLIMYARYANCDPFTIGVVKKNDQLLPYYIMDVASHIPGLTGLFIAGIFCAALSTLSASLNCLAGTIFEDFVLKITGPIKDEKKASFILKILVVIIGIICTGLVFVVEKLGGLVPLVISINAITSGPLVGMFTLGVLFPKASSKGSLYGSIIGLLLTGWIVFMAQYYKAQGFITDDPKPLSIEQCQAVINTTMASFTLDTLSTTSDNLVEYISQENSTFKPFVLFRISYYLYTTFGAFVTITSGLIISYVLKNDDPPVHRNLLSPVIYFMLDKEKRQNEQNKDYYTLDKALDIVTVDTENNSLTK